MVDETRRETLQELIQLQIDVLRAYQELLDSTQWEAAKEKLNTAIKAAIETVGPILTVQHLATDMTRDLHRTAVDQTRALLVKLLNEEKKRADLHRNMREAAERGRPS